MYPLMQASIALSDGKNPVNMGWYSVVLMLYNPRLTQSKTQL